MHLANASSVPDGRLPSGVSDVLHACADAGHMVQFYEDEHYLARAVGDFLAAGLTSGQSLVVIATESCRKALAARFGARGIDVERASREGRVVWADARETLSAIMGDSAPDHSRFRDVVGGMIEEATTNASNRAPVRMYGEMVDLLWKDGNPNGAIRLEDLWNDLASTHPFSLLCAYNMANFYKEADAGDFREICRRHSHVIPTERYTSVDEATRLVEISVLQQRARSLENEVEQRKELERQLRRAREERGRAEEEANAANRAKSEFLAVMSHELRTPLNAIGGHIQLMEMGVHGPVTSAQREALERAQSNQRHLLSLINDVLNLVRIETGRVEYVMETISVDRLLSDVVAMIEPLLRSKRLACEVTARVRSAEAGGREDGEITVVADREKAQQILLNLLTNAIKFTPAGGRIVLDAQAPSDASEMASVQVRDTGIGIPPAKLEQVFEPFVQAGPRPTGQHDGVGLGLAISRDLARGMGGELTAESTVGEGTTLTLSLPLDRR